MRHECLRHAITLGKALIVIAERIDSVEDLVARVRQYS
jgi:5-methylthioribose kinase